MKEREQILLATSIAMELAKDRSVNEICDLIGFVKQISCSLSVLLNMKKNNQK